MRQQKANQLEKTKTEIQEYYNREPVKTTMQDCK